MHDHFYIHYIFELNAWSEALIWVEIQDNFEIEYVDCLQFLNVPYIISYSVYSNS